MIIFEFLFMLALLGIAFLIGFWCGKTYGTLTSMVDRVKQAWSKT